MDTARRAMMALALVPFGGRWARAEESDVTDEFRTGDVTMAVHWDQGEGWLRARYRLVNSGRVAVVVFDRLFHTDVSGKRKIDPDHCWRWLDQGGLYRMAKTVPSVPRHKRVESPEVPYARLLDPGAAIEGQAVVPVPLDQVLPYGQPPQVAGDRIAGVQLTIGYAVVDAAMQARTLEGDVLSLDYGWAEPRQKLLGSAAAAVELPLSGAVAD